jgi:altronate dehydratase
MGTPAETWVVSSVEVAVMVATPVAEGVKTPVLLTAPSVDGVTFHVTAEL